MVKDVLHYLFFLLVVTTKVEGVTYSVLGGQACVVGSVY